MAVDYGSIELAKYQSKAEREAALKAGREQAALEYKMKQLAEMQSNSNRQQQHTQEPSATQIITVQQPLLQKPIINVNPALLTIEDLQAELFKRKQELKEKADNMKLDADQYRVNIPSIRLLLDDKSPAERLVYIGNVSVATNVPIIIVCCYVGELYGFSEELDSKIKSLMSFYTVEDVLNVKRS